MIAVVIMGMFLLTVVIMSVVWVLLRNERDRPYSNYLLDDADLRALIRAGAIDDAATRLHFLAAQDNQRIQRVVANAIVDWQHTQAALEAHPEILRDAAFLVAIANGNVEAGRKRYRALTGRPAIDAVAVVDTLITHQDVLLEHKERHAEESLSDAGLRDLLAAGRFEDAVHAYQMFTGVDRFTAQAAVAAVQQQMRLGVDDDKQSAANSKMSDEQTTRRAHN